MTTIPIELIVEDPLSEFIAKAMLTQTGRLYEFHPVRHWNKDQIRQRSNSINNASRGSAYFVLTDQDRPEDTPCQEIHARIQGSISPNLIYRFAVMETESWVMAHSKAFAQFTKIPENRIPKNPDEILQPKECLIELASRYCARALKEELVPAPGSTSKVGPGYNPKLGEFVRKHWRAGMAAKNSPSLARALRRLREFNPTWAPRPPRRR